MYKSIFVSSNNKMVEILIRPIYIYTTIYISIWTMYLSIRISITLSNQYYKLKTLEWIKRKNLV